VASADVAAQQQKVIQIAIASGSALSATSDLYAKLYGLTGQLGVSSEQAAVATQAITQALTLSGVEAGAAAGAITQLGQALSSGVLRGDEFNSIMEALGTNNPIIQAIAEEFGVAATELRGLAENGELVSDRVFGAIIKAAPAIRDSFGNLVPTLESEANRASAAFTGFAGALNQSFGFTTSLTGALGSLVPALQSATEWANKYGEARAKVAAIEQKNWDFARRQRAGPQGPPIPDRGAIERENQLYRERVELNRQLGIGAGPGRGPSGPGPQAPGGIDEARRGRGYGAFSNQLPFTPTPVNRPAQDLGAAQLGDAPSASGGGRGRSRRATIDDYQRETKALQERTENLRLETEALGLSESEAARRKATLDLERAAEEAGIPITAERRTQIDTLAAAYAAQVEQMELARAAQERLDEFSQQSMAAIKDGFIDVIKGAKSFEEALQGVLDKMLDLVLSQAFDQLFGTGGRGGGGLLSGLFNFGGGAVAAPNTGTGSLFMARGGITRGPRIAGEAGPEAVVPLPDGRSLPVNLQMPTSGGMGGDVQVVVNAPPGSRVESQRTERGPDYRRVVVDIVNDHLASGGADGAMRGRYGAQPRKVR
jgi:tape measure domain-containing protein